VGRAVTRRMLTTFAMRCRGARPRVSRAATVCALGALALGAALGTAPAGATMVASMSTAAQAASADRIVVATVAAVTVRPKASAPQYFETVVRLDVEETVVGSVPGSIELILSGGAMNGVRERVEGMPDLAVGERYVMLLEPDQEPRLVSPFVGFNQGLYRVVGNARATSVVRDRQGQPLAGDGVPASARSAGGEPTLDAFLDVLRAARHP